MAKYIKNNTGSAKTWVGQEIQASAYHLIPILDEREWANDSVLLTAIATEEAIVSLTGDSTGHILTISSAINHLKDISEAPVDVDGAPLQRMKITKTGWHYQLHSIEFETSKLDSVYNKDSSGNNLSFVSMKFYNAAGTELTTQQDIDTDCVKSVMDFEPTFDIEMMGGQLYQQETPTTDIRTYVIAVPDVAAQYGGSIPFIQGGLNLKFMRTGTALSVDGKAPKLLTYSATYHTNKFRIILKHDAGIKHKLMMVFNFFKAV